VIDTGDFYDMVDALGRVVHGGHSCLGAFVAMARLIFGSVLIQLRAAEAEFLGVGSGCDRVAYSNPLRVVSRPD
jgi:hypothetical protein